MKAPFSPYLDQITPYLRIILSELEQDYSYVSILSTDSAGLAVRISQHAKSIGNRTMTTERGTVIRVYRDGLYSEFSLSDIRPDDIKGTVQKIREDLERQFSLLKRTETRVFRTPELSDEPLELFVEKETGTLPEDADFEELVTSMVGISDKGMTMGDNILDCSVTAQSTHISKLFLSRNRFLRQSYVYSEGSVSAVVAEGDQNRVGYSSISGLGGPEIFVQLGDKLETAVHSANELLHAERLEPGEYVIITSPEVTGLIAHEAFGHGVEMDMFVKDRALGKHYIGKRVGSNLVTMHEGALVADNVTSYVFDDEGTLAGDVTEISEGILQTGICDALSAARLGTNPTGNGKRENFAHKVYTRMTNTVFDSGKDTLEEMIASTPYGLLLEGMESGMEDPKHWGIQCIIQMGREIRDGKLTGRVFAPIILTGYVPDLLGNISMVSSDREIFGSGGCGKGHKEWVKVADGGPYLKTIGRLG